MAGRVPLAPRSTTVGTPRQPDLTVEQRQEMERIRQQVKNKHTKNKGVVDGVRLGGVGPLPPSPQ